MVHDVAGKTILIEMFHNQLKNCIKLIFCRVNCWCYVSHGAWLLSGFVILMMDAE